MEVLLKGPLHHQVGHCSIATQYRRFAPAVHFHRQWQKARSECQIAMVAITSDIAAEKVSSRVDDALLQGINKQNRNCSSTSILQALNRADLKDICAEKKFEIWPIPK